MEVRDLPGVSGTVDSGRSPRLMRERGLEQRALDVLWERHRERFTARATQPLADERTTRDELIFCLLGGHGVSFELSLSAAQRLVEVDVFADWGGDKRLRELIVEELSLPQFLPLRRDGRLRRYRYPNRRAELIAGAVGWVRHLGLLTERLLATSDERERRQFLCACPGVGPKTASWLLRNTGYAASLAIIDIHVVRALEDAGRLPAGRLPAAYERFEAAFLRWCDELTATPAAFDLFLWEWQRGSLQ